MNREIKIYKYVIYFIILLTSLFRGGFFPIEYITIAVSLLLIISFTKELKIPVTQCVLLSGVVLMYYFSSLWGKYNTGVGIVESTKPMILLMAVISGLTFEKKHFFKAMIITSLIIGGIGLLSICRIIDFTDFVYIHNDTKSLQSTMQYANTTAVLLISGIYSIRAVKDEAKGIFFNSCIEIFLTVCLLFTHSRIAVAIYFAMTVVEMIILKKGININSLINIACSVMIYYEMLYLVNKRLSFVAFISCLIIIPLICEAIIKIKPLILPMNRYIIGTSAILLSGIIVIISRYTDISTIMIRFLYYKDGFSALMKNPLFGLTPGGWGEYQYLYQTAQYYVRQVHNSVLQIGLDAGIIAMILFLITIFISLRGLIKIWIKEKKQSDLYVLLIFLTLLIHGFFDFDFSFSNILIIFGVCIAYGSENYYKLNMKAFRIVLSAIFIVFFVYLDCTEILLLKAQKYYNNQQYPKALSAYNDVVKLRPFDVSSKVMSGICEINVNNSNEAHERLISSYKLQPDNRNFLMKMMSLTSYDKDYSSYLEYQYKLLDAAPMQQSTYSESMNYLNKFYNENMLEEQLYVQEKNYIISKAVSANEQMSKLNRYLEFGKEIDVNMLEGIPHN